MPTSRIQVTEGSGKNMATHSFTEDAVSKDLQRVNLNDSSGNEVGGAARPLAVNSRYFSITSSALTRPANATPYTSGDSVSNNATAGSVTANSVVLSDINDAPISIERVRLATADTGVQGKAFRIWLFSSDPTAASGVGAGDNAPFSNKQAGFIGCLSGSFRVFADGAVAILTPDEGARIVTNPAGGARTIYWQLQTLSDFTPSGSSTSFTPTFEGFQGRS